MSATTQDVNKWVAQAMTKKGIQNYKVDISGSSSKGDGYLGEISFVKVVADIGKGEKKIYEMVVKSAKTNDELRANSPITETYLREIRVYDEIFPATEELQKQNAIKNIFNNYPECYSTCKLDKKEALVLANMKSLGYDVHDRTVEQNFEHALLVFRNYAKWHGSSLALKIKKPELFKKITQNMTDLMGEFLTRSKMTPVFEKYFNRGVELLKNNGDDDAAKKIMKEADVAEILSKLTLNDDSDAEVEAVILHGDCWNNNMMFKYEGNDKSKPVDMVFIDFQLARLASPILDLSYYLYATGSKSTLDKFDYLLEEYHKTLTDYLQQFNIKSEEVLPLKRLKNSWKKYGRFGLGMSSFIIRTSLCQNDEVVDITGKIGDGTLSELEIGKIKFQKEYDTRLYNIFKHFADKFLC